MTTWERRTARIIEFLRLETIRARVLALAVAAALLPSLLTSWYTYSQNRAALTSRLGEELRGQSSQAVRGIDLWLSASALELRTFATSEAVYGTLGRVGVTGGGGAHRARLEGYLNSVHGRLTDYTGLSVLDLSGKVVAATRGYRLAALPTDWAARLVAGAPALSQLNRGSGRDLGTVTVLVPVVGATGQAIGAVNATISLHPVLEQFTQVPKGTPSRLLLVDTTGVVILAAGDQVDSAGQPRLAAADLGRLRRTTVGLVDFRETSGADAIGTLAMGADSGWAVIAALTAAAAFDQTTRLRNLSILMLAVTVTAVGIFAYWLGLIIVRPLERLTHGAAQVAAGDLAVDLPVTGGGEVGYLTMVFNHMVARLRQGRQELEQLSATDQLTTLHNRRHLVSVLGAECERARRLRHRFSVVMIDIDHFKRYNDTHGHLAGDEALRGVARVIRDTVRQVDCAARYGGEEFLVVLPETALAGALELTTRLRDRLTREPFPGGRVTLSMGVAEYPTHGDNPNSLTARADAALYQAKRDGRDRVVVADETAAA